MEIGSVGGWIAAGALAAFIIALSSGMACSARILASSELVGLALTGRPGFSTFRKFRSINFHSTRHRTSYESLCTAISSIAEDHLLTPVILLSSSKL